MRIPREIETAVVTRLYADATAMDWFTLTAQEHSVQYAKWVKDDEIGGRLREYLTEAGVRVWIKDGPMKELSRSAMGAGKYTHLIAGADQIPARLVRRALGPDWELQPDSVRGKPLRLVARNPTDDSEAVLAWGQATDLKHLTWAALTASAEGDDREWTLCVVETFTRPTPANEKQAHLRLAKRCQLNVIHTSL